MISSDRELDALERIHLSRSPVRQRDLARIIGMSLGMTNAILKRLAQKGLLQVRKVNNRNIQYVVSANGMEEIARRSYSYLKRTIKNVVYYKEAIDGLIREVAAQGFRRLVMVGNSDLDFIVEHFCDKHHLAYKKVSVPPAGTGLGATNARFVLYSENVRPPDMNAANCGSLRSMFSSRVSVQGQSGEPRG